MKKTSNKKKTGVAGKELQRYNEQQSLVSTPTLNDFGSEDQALEYLAEILVAAYFQQKTV